MKPLHWAILGTVWVGMLLSGLLGYAYISRPSVVVPSGPVAPTSDLRVVVAANPALAKIAGAAERDFAEVVAGDSSLKTTGQLRDAHITFEVLLFAKNKGELPGYSAAVGARVDAALGGKSDTDLTAEKRAAFAAALKQVASDLGA